MGIQLFVPKFEVEECMIEIRECLEKGWTGLGYKTVEFEEQWKKYTGLPFAHYLNSATAGLYEAAEKSTVYLIGILILALKMALYQFFKFKSL